MKVLIIDRDRDSCDQMQSILEKLGMEVVIQPIKNKAVDMMRQDPADIIFFDPSPQHDEIRPFIMGVRRSTNSFPPIIVMSSQFNTGQVEKWGGNALLSKPYTEEQVHHFVDLAERISKTSAYMADIDDGDTSSEGGIIAKSAFNELFITCLDRADRYGEHSYIIRIDIANLDEILEKDGAEKAQEIANELKKVIIKTRRSSDIAGQYGQSNFGILIMRPEKEEETKFATNRYTEAMKLSYGKIAVSDTQPYIRVSLLTLPSGAVSMNTDIKGDNLDGNENE